MRHVAQFVVGQVLGSLHSSVRSLDEKTADHKGCAERFQHDRSDWLSRNQVEGRIEGDEFRLEAVPSEAIKDTRATIPCRCSTRFFLASRMSRSSRSWANTSKHFWMQQQWSRTKRPRASCLTRQPPPRRGLGVAEPICFPVLLRIATVGPSQPMTTATNAPQRLLNDTEPTSSLSDESKGS